MTTTNEEERNDDVRHMNDSTMPPPKPKLQATSSSTTATATSTARKNTKDDTLTMRSPAEIAMGIRQKVPPPNTGAKLGLADWMRLLSVTKDIAQLKGQSVRRNITVKEVQQHRTIHDGWMILQQKVYHISPYLAYHPGGINIMKSVLGKDGTILFQKYHPWVNIDGLIGKLLIGYLDTTRSNRNDDDDDNEDGDSDE